MQKTRCLLCSLACPVALDATGQNGAAGAISTEYAAGDPLTQGRLCFKGHYLAEMAAHPFRLTSAALRNEQHGQGAEIVPIDKALSSLGSRLALAGKGAAVVVDGNLPIEDIATALHFAREVVGADLACVYLPDSDAAMLRGIRPRTPILPFEDVATCDVFLAVGDVFATHPVISRPLLEARAARKARLFGMDCMPNRVTGFSEAFLRVKPGAEAVALAALCKMLNREIPAGSALADDRSAAELAELAGVNAAALRAVADALSKAKQPAILLDPVPGRTANVAEAALVASALCEVLGPRLMPMFSYGNAAGAARTAAALSSVSFAEVVEGALGAKVEVLFSIGVDVMRVLSATDASRLRANVSMLAVASAFRSRSTEEADVVLPLAAWFEERGSALNAAGSRIELAAALAPPRGAVSAKELCARLAASSGAALPEEPSLARPSYGGFLGQTQGKLDLSEVSSGAFELVARADTVDLDAGSVSRLLAWPRLVEPAPELCMNAADAATRGLAARSSVRVRANGNETLARLRVSSDVPQGMAAISTAFAETRRLFPRRSDGPHGFELTWSEAEITAS